jgi:hypothetical protein
VVLRFVRGGATVGPGPGRLARRVIEARSTQDGLIAGREPSTFARQALD